MPLLRSELEVAKLTPELLIRAARADLLWARLDGDAYFRHLSVSDLELIFQRYGADVQFRKMVADIEFGRPAVSDLSLESAVNSFREAVGAADSVAFLFTKGIADSTRATDALSSIQIDKLLADIASPVDVAAIAFITQFDDASLPSDDASIQMDKPFGDAVSVGDFRSITLQKMLDDAIIPSDGVSFSFAQSLADALSADDTVSVTVYKTFSDSVTVDDLTLIGKEVPENWDDAASASDAAALTFMTQFSEAISLAETFSLILSIGPYPHSELNGHPLGDWMLGD